MPAREGNWGLLDQGTDPVIADTRVLGELVDYYKKIAGEITSESAVLKSIGDGDDTKFKGATADAVRSKSKEVAESLQKMSGRYIAIRDALTGYLPALETGLAKSAEALADAESAERSGAAAAGMSDPSQGRADDAPPLTAEEQGAVDAKHAATTAANDAMGAAKTKLRNALDTLNGAGQAAAGTIRAAWDDGLHDTGWDKFKAFFAKILKLIVKIFTYIGIALAALAILIPGVGVLAIMGAVAAGVALVAQIGLTVVGEGNVLDLVMAVVGVVTLGIGAGITKATSIAVNAGIKTGTSAVTKATLSAASKFDKLGGVEKLQKLRAIREATIKRGVGNPNGVASLEKINARISKLTDAQFDKTMSKLDRADFTSQFKANVNWWNPKVWKTAKADWDTVSKQFGSDRFTKKGFTSWAERLGGVDFQVARNNLAKWGPEHGFAGFATQAPKWHTYVNGGMSVFGKQWTNIGLILNPSMIGSDTKRPWTDDWSARKHPLPAIAEPPGYAD